MESLKNCSWAFCLPAIIVKVGYSLFDFLAGFLLNPGFLLSACQTIFTIRFLVQFIKEKPFIFLFILMGCGGEKLIKGL